MTTTDFFQHIRRIRNTPKDTDIDNIIITRTKSHKPIPEIPHILHKAKFSPSAAHFNRLKHTKYERRIIVKFPLFPIYLKSNKKANKLSKRFQKLFSEQFNALVINKKKSEDHCQDVFKMKSNIWTTNRINKDKELLDINKQDLNMKLRSTQRDFEAFFWRKRGRQTYKAEESTKSHRWNLLLSKEKKSQPSLSYYLKDLLISTADQFIRDKFKKYKQAQNASLSRNTRMVRTNKN